MEMTLTRNEKIFGSIGLITILGFLIAFNYMNRRPRNLSQFENQESINYEMARPEEGFVGYSLENREIEDEYQALQAAQKNPIKGINAKNTKTAAKSNKPVAPAAKSNMAKTTTVQPAEMSNAAISKPAVKAPSSSDNEQSNRPDESNMNNVAVANNVQAPTEQPNEKHDYAASDLPPKNKKSFAQWRSEIFAKPTKETMTAFITAFRKNEVSMVEFQSMAQDLLEQNDQNLRGLALMALRSQPSFESLAQLVPAQEQASADLQAYIEQAYVAYMQPQYLPVFNQVFRSKNRKVIIKSLAILNTNIQKIKSGDVSGLVDARQRRVADIELLSVNIYKSLLPSLALITASNEPQISALASQVSDLIQSTSQVAGL